MPDDLNFVPDWLKPYIRPQAPSPANNMLSSIMSNPIGTESYGSELRNAQPDFQPGQTVGGTFMSKPMADMYHSGVSNALGWLGTFGGPKAKGWNQDTANWAQELETKGRDPGIIWRTTGMYKGPDGQWRFEIPDQGASLNTGALRQNSMSPDMYRIPIMQSEENSLKLGDILNHPELFKQYPHLANLPVKSTPIADVLSGVQGGYVPGKNPMMYLTGNIPEKILSTGLHEIQHGVQDVEGFAPGGNPEQFLPKGHDVFKADLKAKEAELNSQLAPLGISLQDAVHAAMFPDSNISKIKNVANSIKGADLFQAVKDYMEQGQLIYQSERNAFDKYRKLAGETEARNVQQRQNLTDYDRSAMHPGLTADVPEEEQIVRNWVGHHGEDISAVARGKR